MSVKQLRTQSLFGGYDQLTPGADFGNEDMGYSDDDQGSSPYTPGPTSSGLERVAAQQDRDTVLGPDGRPLESNIKAPTVAPVGAPSPSKGQTFQDYIQQMNEGYTPDYTSRDRLNKLLDAPPERSAPGWARALTAAALSVKAQDPIKTAEQVMYAPYMRDVEEWKTRADPYLKSAELENRQNINERTLVSNAATAYSAAERNRVAEENNQMKNSIAVVRNNIQQAKNSGLKIEKAGDRFIGINPQTGQRYDLGASGGMTREEEINALGEWRVEAARQAGADAMGRTIAAGAENVTAPDGSIVRTNPRDPSAPAPPRGSTRVPSGNSGGTDSALERGRIEQENIRRVMEVDKGARKLIRPRGNNTYGMGPRPVPHEDTWMPGDHVPQEAADEWDRVKKLIDPSYVPPPPTIPRVGGTSSSSTPTTRILNPDGSESTVPQKPQAGGPEGLPEVRAGKRLVVITPDGRKGTIANTPEEIAAAKRSGYRVQGR